MIGRQTVALIGQDTVAVSGQTAATLHTFLRRQLAGRQVRPDIAAVLEALEQAHRAWQAVSEVGHSDVRGAVPVAQSGVCEDEVTAREAGRLLGRSERTARRLVGNPRVASRRGPVGVWLFSRDDVLALREEQRDAAVG